MFQIIPYVNALVPCEYHQIIMNIIIHVTIVFIGIPTHFNMATKRSSSSQPAATKKTRGQETYTTFKKWHNLYKWDYQTLSWLRCDTSKDNHEIVENLWYHLCRKHESTMYHTLFQELFQFLDYWLL